MRNKETRKGFTLIELLIVVAIIAILAAIAVPNFLEAQLRSKVARVKSDMRTAAMAVQAYMVDFNGMPPHIPSQVGKGQYNRHAFGNVTGLTTPIAYLNSVALMDPFCNTGNMDPMYAIHTTGTGIASGLSATLSYNNIVGWGRGWGEGWAGNSNAPQAIEARNHWAKFALESYGPDYVKGPNGEPGGNPNSWSMGDYNKSSIGIKYDKFSPWFYDPSNGTVSAGDIVRFE